MFFFSFPHQFFQGQGVFFTPPAFPNAKHNAWPEGSVPSSISKGRTTHGHVLTELLQCPRRQEEQVTESESENPAQSCAVKERLGLRAESRLPPPRAQDEQRDACALVRAGSSGFWL